MFQLNAHKNCSGFSCKILRYIRSQRTSTEALAHVTMAVMCSLYEK